MKGRFFQMKYKALLMPIDIGCVTVKNRVAMAPINNSNQIDRTTGMINQRVVDFYVDRARGGAGLIVTGVFKVENNVEKCINIKEGLYKWRSFRGNHCRTSLRWPTRYTALEESYSSSSLPDQGGLGRLM